MQAVLNMGSLRGLGSAQVGRAVLTECARRPEDQFLALVPDTWIPGFSRHRNLDLIPTRPGHLRKLHTDQWATRRALSDRVGHKLFSLTDTGTIGGQFPHMLLVQQAAIAAPPQHLDFPITPAERAKLWLMHRYFHASISSVDRFTVQSQYMQNALREQWGIPDNRILVVPSAAPMPPHLLGTWTPTMLADPFILYPASPYAHKNHGVIISALRELRSLFPSLRCVFTVNQDEASGLVARANEVGVLDMIDWRGTQSVQEVWHLMTQAVAVVVPSKLESFGLVYWEALAIGVPLIVADRPFAREACKDAAVYAAPDDAEGFAEAIIRFVQDVPLAQKHSRIGTLRYRKHSWSWNSVVQHYLSALSAL